MSNPEVEKLKMRTSEYMKTHLQYWKTPAPIPVHRKKLHTRKRLQGNEVCAYCGVRLSAYTASRDHIIPLSRGGTDDPDNLVWCCKKCNRDKGSKLLSEWSKEEK